MKATLSIVFLMVSMSVGPLATAGEIDEPLDDQAIVLLEHDGLFIGTPTATNLVVMNVRVFDTDNQLVFNERSIGEPVNLLAVDLPDGEYSYEIVSVLDISAEMAPVPNLDTEKSTRANGHLTVHRGEIVEGRLPNGESLPLKPDQAMKSYEAVSEVSLLAMRLLQLMVPSALAADVIASSAFPTVTFDDSSTADPDEWLIKALGEVTHGRFEIDYGLDTNLEIPVISINGVPDGGPDIQHSLLVDSDGDLHWANNGLNFDRGIQALSIGTQTIGGDLTIGDHTPDIRFEDETGQAAEWQLANDIVTFFGRPIGQAFNAVFRYNVNAPDFSLDIAANGNVGMGLSAPERQLHLKGSNAVFRMDRSTNSAAFMLVRTTGGGTPQKTFVVGTNASGSNNGEFVINDLGTAVAGGGSRRMTINNSGNVNFPGIVTASNIAAPSSRALKKNIEPIADPLALTQQLEGVRFDWKASDAPSLGFIAEDLEEILPEVVLHDEGTGEMLGVNYAAVVPVLVEAVKAQQHLIDEQQLKIATLEEKTAAMKEQQRDIEALRVQLASLQNHVSRLAQLEELVVNSTAEATLAHN